MTRSNGIVYLIGAGPGAPDLVTVRGAQLLARGLSPRTPVLIVENATLPQSRADTLTLHELRHLPQPERHGPALLMIGEVFRAASLAERDGAATRAAAG